MTPSIKPFEGHLALQFLEPEPQKAQGSEDPSGAVSPPDDSDAATLALVVAVGPKSPCKVGDTVFVKAYARHSGTKLDDTTRIVDTYVLVAKVTES